MTQKLSYKDQIHYGNLAKDLRKSHGLSFIDACDVIVTQYDLPISAKTLLNTYAALNNIGTQLQEEMQTEQDEPIYDRDTVICELEKELDACKKKLYKEENKNEVIKYAIEKSVKSIPRGSFHKAYVPDTNSSLRPEIAMLDLSDIHLGKKVDSRDVGKVSYYSRSVFEEQCKRLTAAIQKTVAIQRAGGVNLKHLYINCLGDLIDGEMIYGGHQSEIYTTTTGQIFDLGEYFLQTVFAPLSHTFETITIMAVDGNHGRVGKKREGYDRKTNFDNHLVRYWQHRLFEHRDIFTLHISESPYMIYSLLGKLHLLAHGNNTGNGRWPMSGMERFLTGISFLNRVVIDYLHLAHYHRDMKFGFNFSEILVNGSWIGPSEYSVGKLSAGDYASQRFYGLNDDHITWTYQLYIDEHIHRGLIDDNRTHELVVYTPISEQPNELNVRSASFNPQPSKVVELRKSMGA